MIVKKSYRVYVFHGYRICCAKTVNIKRKNKYILLIINYLYRHEVFRGAIKQFSVAI